MRILPILVMIVAGMLVSLQGPVNARLRVATDSPVLSAAISFLSGTLILLLITACGGFGGFGNGIRGLAGAPWWAYLGGTLGITFVLGVILCLPSVGTVVVISAAVFGQLIGSFLVDSFGWFGVQRIAPSPLRAAGVVIVFLGVLLAQRK
ncbi:MAG: DMT family transporter [Verrucomicrobia bacterium]|nr:DMT family transporter [Verrucomicrobiota bacterium]